MAHYIVVYKQIMQSIWAKVLPNLITTGATIIVIVLGASASSCQSGPDTIFTGGDIWTGVPGAPRAQAMAVRDGELLAVGSDEQIAALTGPGTKVVPLEGRFVVPGFIDNHTHFISGGQQLASVDLRDAASRDEFARRVSQFATGLPAGRWITGGDWDHEMWGGQLPHRDWIDGVSGDNPVFISRLDGHMALANTIALDLAGITADTPSPEGGTIVHDPGTGRPTGILKDGAMALVYSIMPNSSEQELDEALARAMDHAVSLGVTQIIEMGGWGGLATYQRAANQGELKHRVYALVPISTWDRLRDFIVREGRGDNWLRWGGVKGFVDGSLGSTTAWFYGPYDDAPETSGLMVTDTAALRNAIISADDAGLQVAVHAIGDRANDWLLDVYASITTGESTRDRRFRIEHAQHLTPAAIGRFKAQGVIPAMQPYHAIDDGRWAEKRIGPERIKTTYAFRSLLDQGAILSFGSDWTVAPLDPLQGIYAAVTRRTIDGANPDGWVPEEKITVEEALRCYTANNAYAGYFEQYCGTLEAGKLADFVALSRDLFTINPVEIPSVDVKMTVVGGQVMYRAD